VEHTVEGIAYRDEGNGEPVLLIHGSLIADSFEPMVRDPSLAGFRLVRYHRRGVGGSADLDSTKLIRQHAEDAAAVLRYLGIECAHLVGHSYGGLIAAQLALDHPELVHTLATFEPILRTAEEAAEAFTTLFLPLIAMYDAGEVDEALGLFAGFVFGSEWREQFNTMMPGSVDQMRRDAASFFEGDLPSMEYHTIDAPADASIDVPVLFVAGAKGLPATDSYLLELAPDTQSTVVEDVNHAMQMVAPRPFAEATAAFLKQHRIG
jgi:pimeloyl-ACP methyl ester carboxylesterase